MAKKAIMHIEFTNGERKWCIGRKPPNARLLGLYKSDNPHYKVALRKLVKGAKTNGKRNE
jgi:hypothetical protein